MNIELAAPIEMCQDDKSLLIRFTYHAMVRLEQRGITELSVISDLFNVYQGIDSVDEFENQFTFTGATKGADSVKVDLSAEDEDIENLEAFAEKISEALA